VTSIRINWTIGRGNPCLHRGEQIPGGGNTEAVNAARKQKSMAYAEIVTLAIDEARQAGKMTLDAIAEYLNAIGYTTIRGNQWYPATVAKVLKHSNVKSLHHFSEEGV
jgi:hypothetical protein